MKANILTLAVVIPLISGYSSIAPSPVWALAILQWEKDM